MQYCKLSKLLTIVGVCIALVAIAFGSYTRLKDAGLGCPDWPGCYGQITAPKTVTDLQKAQQAFPEHQITPIKATLEMLHRYIAGSLAVCILIIFLLALKHLKNPAQPFKIPLALMCMAIFQALLGMWTVTLKLYPVVVMGHLLGGFTIFSLLWWHHLRMVKLPVIEQKLTILKYLSIITLVLLIAQIALGAWTSSNYAALVCPDFPFCQGKLFSGFNFHDAFYIAFSKNQTYEGGLLNIPARITIHMLHRFSAFVVLLVGSLLSYFLVKQRNHPSLVTLGALTFGLLIIQIGLGIANVVLYLPAFNAVAHTLNATLLLSTVITICVCLFAGDSKKFLLKNNAHGMATTNHGVKNY